MGRLIIKALITAGESHATSTSRHLILSLPTLAFLVCESFPLLLFPLPVFPAAEPSLAALPQNYSLMCFSESSGVEPEEILVAKRRVDDQSFLQRAGVTVTEDNQRVWIPHASPLLSLRLSFLIVILSLRSRRAVRFYS